MTADGRVAVVTDSTAYLPTGVAEAHGITVVPVSVVVAGRPYDEGTEADAAFVAERLRQWDTVTTSRPSPERFLAAYRASAEAGATAVVSVHLSADVSGTFESAELAAKEAPLPVRTVDSRTLAMGLGFGVLAAAQAAEGGAGVDEVAAAAADRCARSTTYFYVDTLEYLRRGGRIGAASALVGSALAIKPLLTVTDGRIAPLEKVRTAGKAVARLEDLAVAAAGERPVEVAVQHLANPERAAALAERLRVRIPDLVALWESEVGAVVGAHVGPGMLGVVVAPALAGDGPPADPAPSTGP